MTDDDVSFGEEISPHQELRSEASSKKASTGSRLANSRDGSQSPNQGTKRFRSFPPWSLEFTSPALEKEFLVFVSPVWYVSLLLYCASIVLGILNFSVSRSEAVPSDPLMRYNVISKLVFASVSLIFAIVCLVIRALHSRGTLSRYEFLLWTRRLRIAFNFAQAFSSVSLALDSRNCAGPDHPPRYVAVCFRSYPVFAITPLLVNLVYPAGFNATLLLLSLPLAEVIFSVLTRTSRGLPVEHRFSRPFFTTFITCLYLFFIYVNERQDRRRFLMYRQMKDLTKIAETRKEQVAATLANICDPEQLQVLLSGRVSEGKPTVATLMIVSVDSFIEWRRHWSPAHSINVLHTFFGAFEAMRVARKIECVYYRGDESMMAVGLSASPVRDDPSPLIQLALKQRSTAFRLAMANAGRRFPQLKLRWGIARGEAVSILVPGTVVYFLVWGPACQAAGKNLKESIPGFVEVPNDFPPRCAEVEIRFGPSERRPGFVVCFGAQSARLARSSNSRPNVLEDASSLDRSSAGSPTNPLGLASPHRFHDSTDRSSEQVSAPPKDPPSDILVMEELSFSEVFSLQQPEGFAHFQEDQAKRGLFIAIAVWFCLLFIYMGIFLMEDELDVNYAIVFLVAFAALVIPILPVHTSKRWLVFLMSFTELWTLLAFPLIRQNSLITGYVTTLINLPLVTFLCVSMVVHVHVTAVAAAAYYSAVVVLSLAHPKRFSLDTGRSIIILILAAGFDLTIVMIKALHNRRAFEFQDSQRRLKAAAVAERNFHEKVLGMLLPRYVVPLVARRQEHQVTHGSDVVLDYLSDVSLLVIKFTPFASWQEMVRVSTSMDRLIMESSARTLHLIHADGDVFSFGGPLQKNLNDLLQRPATSQFAGKGFREFATEAMADDAAEKLIALLSELRAFRSSGVGYTAVLHRGDGLASVFGNRRPIFTLLGPVIEMAHQILEHHSTLFLADSDSISPFSSMSSTIATSHFVECAHRFSPDWVRSLPPSTPFAVKSVGLLRLYAVPSMS